jgi:predicted RNA-binding protein associated with RNAse of E/G family
MSDNALITVIKRNLRGEETWRYSGMITRQEGTEIHLEALFNGKESPFMGTVIRQGDRFLETYYTDRWYNIYEIHDRESDELKGWYCNIGYPAVLEAEDRLSYVDLALDLWVTLDGTQTVLDEDEFDGLELDDATRQRARAALEELRRLFKAKRNPNL